MSYRQQIGDLLVDVPDAAERQHDYRYGVVARVTGRWNEGYSPQGVSLSVSEMRDLRYLLDRAIEQAEEAREKDRANEERLRLS